MIAKTIVTEAARTGRGIAVEQLTGIRDRVRLRKPQRVTLSSWSFHQLGGFLAYKARRAGVPLVEVDPRYTPRTCADCGYRDKRNRPNQETFHCGSCGVVAHADHNAARTVTWTGAAPASGMAFTRMVVLSRPGSNAFAAIDASCSS